MGDRRDGYSRRGGGDRSYNDDRDRRRDRHHDRARDYGRDRERDGGRDRDREHRRYRSRSRDRGDRDQRGDRRRSRSPGRERGHDRRDGERDRDRERDRGYRRRDEERGDRSVREDRDKPSRDKDRGSRGVTESVRGSASPSRMFERDTDEHPQLPTRSKPNAPAPAPAAPVSFKVKTRDGSHGPEPRQTREDSQEPGNYEDGERRQSRGRFDADPMDQDDEEEVEVEDEGLDDMAAMMGFGGFGTTKGKKVLGNNVGGLHKQKKTEYRQYMNRVGGFNRPLSPGR